MELALLFYLQGWSLPSYDPSLHTFRDLATDFKQVVAAFRTFSQDGFIPGRHNRHRNKCIGKSLPNGTIDGAEIYFDHEQKVRFAHILASVSTARLQAWAFCLDSAES